MVRQHDWRDPYVLNKIRIRIQVLLVIIAAAIVFLQHEKIMQFFTSIFK